MLGSEELEKELRPPPFMRFLVVMSFVVSALHGCTLLYNRQAVKADITVTSVMLLSFIEAAYFCNNLNGSVAC